MSYFVYLEVHKTVKLTQYASSWGEEKSRTHECKMGIGDPYPAERNYFLSNNYDS